MINYQKEFEKLYTKIITKDMQILNLRKDIKGMRGKKDTQIFDLRKDIKGMRGKKDTQIFDLREDIKSMKKELQYYSSFKRVQTHNLQPRSMGLMNAAKDIGVPPHGFLRALRREDFIYYHRGRVNYPGESWVKCGFFERRGSQTFMTEAGREFFKHERRVNRFHIY